MSDELLVVLDSGIWISAFRFGGIPLEAVRQALREDRILICVEIEAEVKRVMLTKFGSPVLKTAALLEAFLADAVHIPISGLLKGVCRDPKDDMIFECADRGRANLIVSGDQDVLAVAHYADSEVLKPRQYVDRRRSPAFW